MTQTLVSLNEARKLGLAHYFTGKPCKYGHVQKRQVSNRGCVECLSQRAMDWAKENPNRSQEIRDKWNFENKEKEAARARLWRKNNPDTYKRMVKEWRKNNSTHYRAYMAKCAMDRAAAKKNRTPAWLSEDDHWLIQEAYDLAAMRTDMFGFQWHVDHVVPLRGKDVSGLHVPWNLQVIPGVENKLKSNKFLGT
jgi:hypothetical protein